MNPRKLFLALVFLALNCTINAEEIHWLKNYKEATALARETGKPILIDFTAVWCKPCLNMDKVFWTKREVIEVAQKFVCLKADFDKERSLATKFGVRAIPNVIFTDAWGMPLVFHRGFGTSAEPEILKRFSYVPTDFSEVLEAGRLLENNEDDLAALYKFSAFYDKRGFYYQSNEFNIRILKLEKDASRRPELLIKTGFNYVKTRNLDEALDIFEKFQKEFPESPLAEACLYGQTVAYFRNDKMKNAQRSLSQLKTRFPNSKLVAEAEKILAGPNTEKK